MTHCGRKISWADLVVLPLVAALLGGLLAGCGDEYVALVSVSPASTWVAPGGQVEFSAIVVGIEDDRVTWAVNGEVGGSETYGTITEDGVYTAPFVIPDDGTVTICATCVADPLVYRKATTTIVGSFSIEMEDYTTYYNAGGYEIQKVGCSGASGGRAVSGFDAPGDYVAFLVKFDAPGKYDATLRQAAPSGARNDVKLSLGSAAGQPDQEIMFQVHGEGMG